MRLLPFFFLLVASSLAFAQESSPSPSATASPQPGVSPSPIATPAPAAKASVKIQFLPPPIEGTISLGIYDSNGKLVRVLHREAKTDDFTIAADGLITKWDGRDDAGMPLPAGKYHGRGYSVAVSVALTGTAPDATASPSPSPESKIRLHLVSNPLDRDRAGAAEVSVGISAQGSFLQLTGGLPLKRISATPNLKWASLTRAPQSDSLTVVQSDGATIETYTVTKAAKMMSFDCGGFDLSAD